MYPDIALTNEQKAPRVNWRAFTVDSLNRVLSVNASSISYAGFWRIEINGKRERKIFHLTTEIRDEQGEVVAWELEHFESGWKVRVNNV